MMRSGGIPVAMPYITAALKESPAPVESLTTCGTQPTSQVRRALMLKARSMYQGRSFHGHDWLGPSQLLYKIF